MIKYTIEYSINYRCHEFKSNEVIVEYDDLMSAVKAFVALANDENALDFSEAAKEVKSWDLQEGDYEFGEPFCGQINLYVYDAGDYRHILHADYSYDLNDNSTSCNGIELGKNPNDDEIAVMQQLGIL